MKRLAFMIMAAGLIFASCSTSKNTDSRTDSMSTDSTTVDTVARDTSRMERPTQ